jgi:hypothetical protein
MRRAAQLVGTGFLFAHLALASVTAQQQSKVCATPEYRQFDFWIGRWSVKQSDGTVAGTNTITRQHGGCVILESWVGRSGTTGTSVNIYNAVTKQWHQSWVDSDGSLVAMDGEFRDGAIRMAGHMYGPRGRQKTRMTWTPLTATSLRQVWETSSDDGRTWRTVFDGVYEPATGK